MSYRILVDENVPRGLEGVYAAEVARAADARELQRQAEYKEKRLKEAQIKETLAKFEEEGKKREEAEIKARGERERERFVAGLKHEFFERNPGATQSDWLDNWQAIVGDAMRERAAGRGPVDLAKQQLLATGNYEF